MKKIVMSVGLMSMVLSIVVPCHACGPYFAPYYLVLGNEHLVLKLKAEGFSSALKRHTDIDYRAPRAVPWLHRDPEVAKALYTVSWDNTNSADIKDLENALREYSDEDHSKTVRAYLEFRNGMKDFSVWKAKKNYEIRIESSGWMHDDSLRNLPDKAPFSIDDHEELLAKLPKEFSLYVRGAAAYHGQDYSRAIELWEELMNLPPGERQYRSTWAAFMIGKAWLKVEPEKAIEYFEKTRSLVTESFADSLNLAADSLGWQAKAESESGRHADAVRRYYEVCKGDNPDAVSLSGAIWRAINEDVLDPKLFTDPICRELVTASLEGNSFRAGVIERVHEGLRNAGADISVKSAGLIARQLYTRGDITSAERWLSLADPDDPYSRWVESKLLLRKGKVDEALAILHTLIETFPSERMEEYDGTFRNVNNVSNELGTLLLGRKEYVSALDAFMHGGYWFDAAYIAERVLKLEELGEYLKTHEKELESLGDNEESPTRLERLQYLYARRLARNHEWEKAKQLFPENSHPLQRWSRDRYHVKPAESYESFLKNFTKVENSELPNKQRAKHYFNAAQIMGNAGLGIIGTEVERDWAITGGGFTKYLEQYAAGATRHRLVGIHNRRHETLHPDLKSVLTASEDEKKRAIDSATRWDKPRHYKYYAAELMWKCAKLLPDNDPLTAHSLWHGGDYLKKDDPEAADRFYKALVNRCRKLEVGQEADRLRWFPPETDLPSL